MRFTFPVARSIRAMATTAFAAVAAPQMIARREDHARALAVIIFAFDERRLLLATSYPLYCEVKLRCSVKMNRQDEQDDVRDQRRC